jgi:hypothetical protein
MANTKRLKTGGNQQDATNGKAPLRAAYSCHLVVLVVRIHRFALLGEALSVVFLGSSHLCQAQVKVNVQHAKWHHAKKRHHAQEPIDACIDSPWRTRHPPDTFPGRMHKLHAQARTGRYSIQLPPRQHC